MLHTPHLKSANMRMRMHKKNFIIYGDVRDEHKGGNTTPKRRQWQNKPKDIFQLFFRENHTTL